MILIIGGAYEGKTEYAEKTLGISESEILDGRKCDLREVHFAKAVNNFHVLIKRLLEDNRINTNEFIDEIYSVNPDITIISDEIGCGIIPLEKSERLWREETGRACCKAAELSDVVVRINCGIPSVIKGELP